MEESRESRVAAVLARGLSRVRRCCGRASVSDGQSADRTQMTNRDQQVSDTTVRSSVPECKEVNHEA